MAKNDLTLVFKKDHVRNLSELFNYNKYDSRKLISVKDVNMVQLVDESHYKGYVILTKENYSSLIISDEMYPSSTIDFFAKNKNDIDLFNLHYTGGFGKSTVKEIVYYIYDRYSINDLFVLEDKEGLIYPFSEFIKLMNDLF